MNFNSEYNRVDTILQNFQLVKKAVGKYYCAINKLNTYCDCYNGLSRATEKRTGG